MQEAIELMTTSTKLVIPELDAVYCYGASLQTCTDIVKHSYNEIFHMEEIEFLEMIGRFADCAIADITLTLT